MTIRQLRTLVAIADAKTFSAAAGIVNVTHAAVSQQMQALEADLDVTLFNRTARTPELTPVALEIVAKARELISAYDNLVPSVMGDGGLSGTISLGVMRTTLTGLTPRGVAALKAKYPDVGLHLRTGLTAPLLSEIERGRLDAAIVSKPHQMPVGVVFRELTIEPMHLIAAPDEVETDPLKLLAARPFIRFNRAAVVGALIDNWINARKIKVSETMELDSPEAITSMVHANLGVSIVPALAIKPPHAASTREISLGPNAPQRVLGLVHQEGHPKTRALDELFDAFKGVVVAADR